MITVDPHLQDDVYRATQAQATRERLKRDLQKKTGRDANNNKGGR